MRLPPSVWFATDQVSSIQMGVDFYARTDMFCIPISISASLTTSYLLHRTWSLQCVAKQLMRSTHNATASQLYYRIYATYSQNNMIQFLLTMHHLEAQHANWSLNQLRATFIHFQPIPSPHTKEAPPSSDFTKPQSNVPVLNPSSAFNQLLPSYPPQVSPTSDPFYSQPDPNLLYHHLLPPMEPILYNF